MLFNIFNLSTSRKTSWEKFIDSETADEASYRCKRHRKAVSTTDAPFNPSIFCMQLRVTLSCMLRKYRALGEFIKAERTRREISQTELAATVRITNSMLSMTESGKARPGPDTLDAIAKQLDLDANFLRELAGYQQIDAQTVRASVHSLSVPQSAIDKPRPLVLQALRILLRLNDDSLRVGIRQLQALESLHASTTKDGVSTADNTAPAAPVSKGAGTERTDSAGKPARKPKR